jgi:hypothetical protein
MLHQKFTVWGTPRRYHKLSLRDLKRLENHGALLRRKLRLEP